MGSKLYAPDTQRGGSIYKHLGSSAEQMHVDSNRNYIKFKSAWYML